jgi:hypothetical protein
LTGLAFDALREALKAIKDYLDGPPPYYTSTDELRSRLRHHGINDLHSDPALVETIIRDLVP